MVIDIICLLLVIWALFKGYRQGLIVAIFSYLAFMVGLAAAMKLSVIVAARMGTIVKVSDKWLPFLAFAIVLIVVILLVKWLARLLQLSVEKLMMGWLNRLGGMALFVIIYISIFSVILFYINKMHLLPQSAVDNSVTYKIIQPAGEKAINAMGYIIPFFKGLFAQLEQFFGKFSVTA